MFVIDKPVAIDFLHLFGSTKKPMYLWYCQGKSGNRIQRSWECEDQKYLDLIPSWNQRWRSSLERVNFQNRNRKKEKGFHCFCYHLCLWQVEENGKAANGPMNQHGKSSTNSAVRNCWENEGVFVAWALFVSYLEWANDRKDLRKNNIDGKGLYKIAI